MAYKKGDNVGDKNPFWGKRHSPEIMERIRVANLGHVPWNKGKKGVYSEQTLQKMREGKLGKPGNALGKKRSLETCKKISESKKGKPTWNKGRLWIERRGENHHRWIKDRSLVKMDKERGGPLHKQWSRDVKNRDGWKCKISNNNCSGRLESHHILGWNQYPELRYQLNNGITLCHAHHPRKRTDEARLSPYFQSLIEDKA